MCWCSGFGSRDLTKLNPVLTACYLALLPPLTWLYSVWMFLFLHICARRVPSEEPTAALPASARPACLTEHDWAWCGAAPAERDFQTKLLALRALREIR